MNRYLAAAAVFALTMSFVAPHGQPTEPSEEPSASEVPAPARWGARADTAISRALARDVGNGTAYYHAMLADAIARRSPTGWNDPRALDYLNRVVAARFPNGGWGLGYPYDAFSDGTVNPAGTTYTVTLTAQVGPVLLAAYQAGKIEREVITSLVQRLYEMPKVAVTPGYCIAYSESLNDTKSGLCTHNVNASVALFLHQVESAGLPASQLWMTRTMIQETAAYRINDRSWPYFDSSPNLNDPGHNALNIDAMMHAGRAVGRDALLYWMPRNNLADPRDFWLHVMLAEHDCEGSYRWLTEFDTEIAKPPNLTFELQAQAARMAARAADTCG